MRAYKFPCQGIAHVAAPGHTHKFRVAACFIQAGTEGEGIAAAHFLVNLEVAFGFGCQLWPVGNEQKLAAFGKLGQPVCHPAERQPANPGIHFVKNQGRLR